MYDIFTETELLNTRNIVDLEDARDAARLYAAQGHQVEIRDAETGETVELFNIPEDD